MRTLRLYILKEFIPPYIGSMAFFSMLLLMERVMSFVSLVTNGYATVWDFILLIFYSVPPTLAITMPMSTLMGALVSVGRISNDSEITAVRAGGIRLNSVFLGLYITGVCIGVLSFYLTDYFVPIGNIKFRSLYQNLTIARPDVQVDVHSINRISGNVLLLVDEVDERTGDLVDVTIFESAEGEYTKTITAKKGWFLSSPRSRPYITLRLQEGTIIDPKDKTDEKFDSTVFNMMDFNIFLSTREMKNIVKTPRDMNLTELKAQMQQEEKRSVGFNTYAVEYHKKIAIPFACVLFVFLGTPFVISRGRSGRGLGLGVGVLIIFLYYIFLLFLERVGRSGTLPPAFAIWLPNLLFFVAGMYNLLSGRKV
ncbi:MAG: LptF/LptG family permease [Spirochaetes bacterium]|nr:LptF/LptG family permease [Spirochaetota bacterium]